MPLVRASGVWDDRVLHPPTCPMKRPLALLLATCLVAMAVFLGLELLGGDDVTGSADLVGNRTKATAPDAGRLMADDAGRNNEDTERRELVGLAGAIRRVASDKIIIRGVCVDAVTAKPVEGCSVTLDWGLKEQFVTTADGAFRHQVKVDRPINFHLLVAPRIGLEISREWYGVRPGTDLDLGNVKIHPGCRLRGVLVDSKDSPLPGVSVSVHCGGGPPQEWDQGLESR